MSSKARIYVDKTDINNEYINIKNEDIHHLKNVLRLKTNDEIVVCNNDNIDYLCKLDCIDGKVVAKIVESYTCDTEPKSKNILFQAFAKGDKMESIVQKATELGVTEIYPVFMERCVSRPDGKSLVSKIERYNKIALAASSQCHRGVVPIVHNAIGFQQACEIMKDLDCSFVCYEGDDTIFIKNLLEKHKESKSFGFLIGPEGGIADHEAKHAYNNEIPLVDLGKRILRTETASSYVLSALSVIFC